ncbi:MAG: exodeoxyribonuclease V subunit gamma [Propionibacteriaceae bacterium]|nr:exodeoxyribonuclease V subunit gamma [Propionibacteriaceae bacterium]
MIRYQAAMIETLADRLGRVLATPPADPFAPDLVLTRQGGLSRWLAQRLSLTLGSSGATDGVCAGTRFATCDTVAALVRPGPSPWSAEALVPAVLGGLVDLVDTPAFAQVRAHLAGPATRPHRRDAFARATAARLAGYARWHPGLLAAWRDGRLISPGGAPLPDPFRWQADLVNRLSDMIGSPEADTTAVCRRAAESAAQYARIAVFCPEPLAPADERLLQALDVPGRDVLVFTATYGPGGGLAEPLARANAATLDRLDPRVTRLEAPARPVTLLTSLQQAQATGEITPAPFDASVQIHPVQSDQQVDALADTLVTLLARDPTLEPRDILVLVHGLETHLGLLQAFFRPDDTPGASPRHTIRATIATGAPPAGTVADVLAFVISLVRGRATADDLTRLLSFPAVMAFFGYGPEDLDRLHLLVTASGIRWGVSGPQRAGSGMADFAQNTWMAGLGRLVLGVALSEDDLEYRGTVLPLDAVDSDTVRLVEALGQIIAGVRACGDLWSVPAPPADWAERFRAALDALTGPDWAATPVGAALAAVAARTAPPLTLAEAESLFRAAWADQTWHSAFLTGDLAVTRFGTLTLVPHRCVVVLGLDADTFPGQPPTDGDAVTAAAPAAAEDQRQRDRQVFADAVRAARDTLVVIYPGADAAGAVTPRPTPLTDLLHLAARVAGTSDLAAEAALVTRRTPAAAPPPRIVARPRQRELVADIGPLTEVTLDDLGDVFANPARYWLRRHAGLIPSALRVEDPAPVEMSLVPTALDSWEITQRMVRLLLGGKDPDRIVQAELRRGQLPPGEAGAMAAADSLTQAQDIVFRARAHLTLPLTWRSLDLAGDGVPGLTGQVGVHGTTTLEVLAGRVQPHHQIRAWLRLLALQVAYPGEPWRAVLTGRRLTVTLVPPPGDEANRELDYLRRVHQAGLASPLPLPPAPAAHLARYAARALPPNLVEIDRRLDAVWERDPAWPRLWPTPAAMQALPAHPDETRPGEAQPTRFLALACGVYVPLIRAGGVS